MTNCKSYSNVGSELGGGLLVFGSPTAPVGKIFILRNYCGLDLDLIQYL